MATEKRLIDANALTDEWNTLIKKMRKDSDGAYPVDFAIVISAVSKAPTVDAVEVVHGEWSTIEDDYCGLTALQCSECNQEYWFEDEPPIKIYNYCPNCGAKMDGDGND